MNKCKCCNFETERKSNYDRHIKTKRHLVKMEIASKNPQITSKKTKKNLEKIYKCNYCNKDYTRLDNLTRHHTNCIKYIVYNNDKQFGIYEIEIKELKTQLKDKDIEIKELNNTIHQINNKQISVLQNNLKPSNTNNSQIIINNYPNAPNLGFPDNIPVDESLKEYIQLGGIKGLSKFISDYWVKDVKPIDRSIWMVDPSRNKFLIRCKDSWVIDIDGTQFQELNLEKIQNIFDDYITKYEFDTHDQIKTMEFINDIKTKNMIVKGLKDAGKYLVYDKERFTDFETIENETVTESVTETIVD